MNDDKLVLYEALVRASFVVIFFVALSVGTFGLIAISRMLLQQAVANSQFVAAEATLAESVR